MEFILWFAQAKAAKPGPTGILFQFLPFIIIFVLFWFLIIRPQRKRENEHKDMLGALKKGDKILTSSGIFGEVYSLDTQRAVIEIAPKVKITIQRSSIAGVVSPEVFAEIQKNAPVSSGGKGDSSSNSSSGRSGKLKKKKK